MNSIKDATDKLVQAARKVVEWDGGTRYEGDDDEVGIRACCLVVSYESHAQDCCIAELHAALKETSHEAE